METLTQTLTRQLGLGTTESLLSLFFKMCPADCLSRLPAFGCGAYQVNYLLIGESQQMCFFL